MALDIVLPSALRTAGTASGSTFSEPKAASLRAELDVTASTAPTTLDVKIEHSRDGGTSWYTLAAFTQVGAVATARQSLAIPAPNSGLLRVTYTVVGTNYTFSVQVQREESAV